MFHEMGKAMRYDNRGLILVMLPESIHHIEFRDGIQGRHRFVQK